MLAAKLDNLSSIPRTYMVEREDLPLQVVLSPPHLCRGILEHTHMHTCIHAPPCLKVYNPRCMLLLASYILIYTHSTLGLVPSEQVLD